MPENESGSQAEQAPAPCKKSVDLLTRPLPLQVQCHRYPEQSGRQGKRGFANFSSDVEQEVASCDGTAKCHLAKWPWDQQRVHVPR